MNVPMKSATGYSTMPIECNLLTKRIIFIEGEITQDTAVETCKSLLFLAAENHNFPVDIIINSNGGAVDAGLLILDAMEGSGLEIHTWCLSRAFSKAALIFSAGSKRYILKHAELMLHQPLVSATRIEGNVSIIKAVSVLAYIRHQKSLILFSRGILARALRRSSLSHERTHTSTQ